MPALTIAWTGFRGLLGQQAGKEHVDAGKIFDEDKVAPLLAIGIAARALEHADGSGVVELAGEVVEDAGHAPLVLLARAVDVEVAQADDGALDLRHQAADIVVEDQLREAIDIQRTLVRGVDCEAGARAIDSSRGGIDERHLALQREVQQLLGVGEVVVHHVVAIVFKRVGAGALMQDGANFCVFEVAVR